MVAPRAFQRQHDHAVEIGQPRIAGRENLGRKRVVDIRGLLGELRRGNERTLDGNKHGKPFTTCAPDGDSAQRSGALPKCPSNVPHVAALTHAARQNAPIAPARPYVLRPTHRRACRQNSNIHRTHPLPSPAAGWRCTDVVCVGRWPDRYRFRRRRCYAAPPPNAATATPRCDSAHDRLASGRGGTAARGGNRAVLHQAARRPGVQQRNARSGDQEPLRQRPVRRRLDQRCRNRRDRAAGAREPDHQPRPVRGQ
ncbi:hypothetical protein D9M73_144210 [compost metagenome]